jgi:hypothetical protein
MNCIQTQKIQAALKGMIPYQDLYGLKLIIDELNKYQFVSIRKSSVPGPGSPTFPVSKVKPRFTKIVKAIYHSNGRTTIITDAGYAQYWS